MEIDENERNISGRDCVIINWNINEEFNNLRLSKLNHLGEFWEEYRRFLGANGEKIQR